MTISAPTPPLPGSITPFCNAHHLRELKALIEIKRSRGPRLCATFSSTPQPPCGKPRKPASAPSNRTAFRAWLTATGQAVREGLCFHRRLPAFDPAPNPRKRKKQRPGHNLLIRLKIFKDETLRFLVDFAAAFTNNPAEQDLRMTKVKMKISGCFRTFEGAGVFIRLRTHRLHRSKTGVSISS